MAASVGVEMDYIVDATARVGPAASAAALGDRLLSVLEASTAAPAVAQDVEAGTIGAAFVLDAGDVLEAGQQARRRLLAALGDLGVSAELVELHVSEAPAPPG